ncbi:hypothetical protein BDB00DRAFT_808296 [Zychaea mexicana]|uniref:uncharacterized protein n=1 Tax=Zychaea mexicana TaxID=64656 RepID=UPI0022FE13C5|nr:uncharacterized protein BDB00DRAFT_808296 [Zychaea mexicana]KAI9496675.1 hypothetical protein BDB00DRAFT_808296 [Zychaea mexicana]
MDPYLNPLDQSIPDDDLDDDELLKLEQELAPKATDYYGILNVSRKATDEEIKDAYKKLCRYFHPDKHNNAENKKLAEAKFQVIQTAYEVISDPTKRAIYDTYGEEGLSAKWEIGPKFKTPEEMREEYEKKARLQREQDLDSLVRSRGEVQISVDASSVFDPYEPPVFAGFGQPMAPPKKKGPLHALTKAQLQQLFMRHSFEAQIGAQTRAVISGSMVSRNGMGGGNIMGTVRHTVSPKLWAEASSTLLHPRVLSLKTYYNPSSDSFINSVAQTRTFYAPPILSVTAGRRLYATTTGYVTYRTGEWSLLGWGGDVSRKMDRSSVALGIAGGKKQGSYSVELQTGIIASHIAVEYTRKLPHNAQLRLSGVISTAGGLSASVGSDHKVSEHTRIGMSLECGIPSGVLVKFRVSRLGQKVVLPIILSTEFDLQLAFFGAVVPVSVAVALDQLLLKPRRRKQIKEKIQQLREEHAEYLAMRKQEALEGQQLMVEVAARKMRQEEKKQDGLVVIKAWYGRLDDTELDEDSELPEEIIDVSVVIQALVNDSRVTVPGGHAKTNILGIYDPCLGERKQLRVLYRFQHRLHTVTVEDTTPLICPMRAHLV